METVLAVVAVIAVIWGLGWATGGYRQFEMTINQRPRDLRRADDEQGRVVPHTHVTHPPRF